jgi:ribosome-associated toxin RatA of RatAB toxin-antitoxin module
MTFASTGLSALMLALMLVIVGGAPVGADESDQSGAGEVPAIPAAAGVEGIDVRVSRGPAGIQIEGRCRILASSREAWSVLTDYDGIDRFVSSMRESRIAERRDGEILVDQEAVGGMLFFRRRIHVRLRVHEEPPGRIRFEDVLRRDFTSYQGEWRVEERGDGVEITYRVSARPAFSIPDFLARGAFRRTVRELLSEVRVEMERRAMLARR